MCQFAHLLILDCRANQSWVIDEESTNDVLRLVQELFCLREVPASSDSRTRVHTPNRP